MVTDERWGVLLGALLAVQCGGDSVPRPGAGDPAAEPDPGQPGDDDAPESCLDTDGDGFGLRCDAGADCDDADPAIHAGCLVCGSRPQAGCPCEGGEPVECHSGAPEVDAHGRLRCFVGDRSCVDGAWGECVFTESFPVDSPAGGMRDAMGPPAACGNCDPGCFEVGGPVVAGDIGAGNTSGTAFDAGAGGVIIVPGGAAATDIYAYIAMPSYAGAGGLRGAVAKVQMDIGLEVGRYYVGEAGRDNSSSRTAIDGYGNAYVANRAFGTYATVTKIAGDLSYCRNGAATTSVDSVPLAIGTDDCVLWTTRISNPPLNNRTDAIARGLAVDRGDAARPEGYIWVGTWNDEVNLANAGGRAYRLDGDGNMLTSVQLPIKVYGLAADNGTPQRIWASTTQGSGELVAIRINGDGTFTVEGPFAPSVGAGRGYGVTFDGVRIWQAAQGSNYARGYDPVADTWCLVNAGASGKGIAVRMNLDGTTSVYQGSGSTLRVWDPALPCVSNDLAGYSGVVSTINLGAAFSSSIGVGCDGDNRVWSIMRGSGNIAVYDPETGVLPAVEYPTTSTVPSPYTYSDFTGYGRAMFSASSGRVWFDYGVTTPACAPGQVPRWGDLRWTGLTPVGTSISFAAQTALDLALLDSAPHVPLGTEPGTAQPVYIDDALDLAGEPREYPFLRVLVQLMTDNVMVATPVLTGLTLDWVCVDSS